MRIKMPLLIRVFFVLQKAAGLGFEPRYSASKADVLPLDDPAMNI